MTNEINEIVQLFARLSGDVDEEIQRLTRHYTPVSGVKTTCSDLVQDWTARGDEVFSGASRSPSAVFDWRTEGTANCSRSNSSSSLSAANKTTISHNHLVTDSVKSSTPHHSSYDSLKEVEEEAKRLGSRHPSPHVTPATKNNVIYWTSCKQPEVTKCPEGNRAQRLTLSTESYFDKNQHDLQNGGSLSISPVAYHSSRLPDKMSEYEDVWASPSHRLHHNTVQKTRIQSRNVSPGFEKKETVDSAGEQKHPVRDQNANYVLSQSLTEDEPVHRNQQQILDYLKPFDNVPQLPRKYSEPSRGGCISGSAAHFPHLIRPEAEEKFTETAMIGEHSFDGIQTADGDNKSKKSQMTVHRSLSECSRTMPCNDFLWPTMGRPDAKHTEDAWKPVQTSRNSSTSRVSNDLLDIYGTIEQQCGETPFTISSGFSPAIDLRPLTVSEVIGHIAPHLLIRPIRGRSLEDTNPPSFYDNLGCSGTSSPQRTPTSSTYTDYLPPWDDFSVNRLFGRAHGLNQLTAETGADLYVGCLDEMSKSAERATESSFGAAQRHQRPASEESQRCQRPIIDDKGQYCQTPSNVDDQFNQRPSINESVSQKVSYSSQDCVRDFLDVDLAMCDKSSFGSQENNIVETQQMKISRGERHDTSKNEDMKALGSRLDEHSRIQDIKQIATRGLETLDVENCTTIAKTSDHESVGLEDRDTMRDIPLLHCLKRTRGKSTDASESQSKGKTKTPKRVILNAQETKSLQTLDYLTPTFQNQKPPSNLTSSGKRRPYPRQLSLPCHIPARTAPLPRLKSNDVVLDDSAFSLDDPSPTLDFRHPCHMRPSTPRRTSCLASIPPSISQSPISEINRVSFPMVAQRNLSPVPLSENLASNNLHIKDAFQSPIQEEEFFGRGSFRYISRKPELSPTERDLPSLTIRNHQESNIVECRTTTKWTLPEVQEWSSFASVLQTFRPPKVNRILVSYLTSLSERKETFFGSLIQTFISSTKQATNRNPRHVCRNVRQFLSGVSNYLTGSNCDSEISQFLAVILDESSSSSAEATVEVSLQNSVIRPLKNHIFHLIQEQHSRSDLFLLPQRNEDEKLLRLGLKKASHRSPAELQLKSDLIRALETQMDLIKDHFRRMVEAESALSKLECLRDLTFVVFSIISNQTTRASRLVDKALDQDFLEIMKYLLVQFDLSSAEAEADFIRDLNRSSLLTEVDVYVIRSFGQAVDELKKLGMTEMDLRSDTPNSCRP